MKTFNDYLEMIEKTPADLGAEASYRDSVRTADIDLSSQNPIELAKKVKRYQKDMKEYWPWNKISSRQDKAAAYEYAWEVLEKILNIEIYPDNTHLEDEFQNLVNAVLRQLTGLSTFGV